MKKNPLYGGLILSFLFVLCLPLVLAAETTPAHGDELFLQGLYEEAIAAYEKELEMTDDPALVYDSMAIAYYRVGNTEQAIYYFQLAGDADPDSAIPWFKLAALYELVGDLDAAEEYYLKTAASTEPLAAVCGYLGAALLLLEKEDLYGVADRVEASLAVIEGETDPEAQELRTQIYYTLGYVYASIGENEAALSAFTAATQTGTKSPIPWIYLGGFLEDTGMYEQALLSYQEALARDAGILSQEMHDFLVTKLEA